MCICESRDSKIELLQMNVLSASQIKKSYRVGADTLDVIIGIDFELFEGESVAIMGPSGSGKTTLLQVLGVMLKPDFGRLSILDHDVVNLSDRELSQIRRRQLGFIFQRFNLLGTMSAVDNISWPLVLDGRDRKDTRERALELLERVGLKDRAGHFPHQLSGGEQQRVAIARALVAKPCIVFADEPTGALDSKTGIKILELLKDSVRTEGGSLVMVTHDQTAANYCDRLVLLKDGKQC